MPKARLVSFFALYESSESSKEKGYETIHVAPKSQYNGLIIATLSTPTLSH